MAGFQTASAHTLHATICSRYRCKRGRVTMGSQSAGRTAIVHAQSVDAVQRSAGICILLSGLRHSLQLVQIVVSVAKTVATTGRQLRHAHMHAYVCTLRPAMQLPHLCCATTRQQASHKQPSLHVATSRRGNCIKAISSLQPKTASHRHARGPGPFTQRTVLSPCPAESPEPLGTVPFHS